MVDLTSAIKTAKVGDEVTIVIEAKVTEVADDAAWVDIDQTFTLYRNTEDIDGLVPASITFKRPTVVLPKTPGSLIKVEERYYLLHNDGYWYSNIGIPCYVESFKDIDVEIVYDRPK